MIKCTAVKINKSYLFILSMTGVRALLRAIRDAITDNAYDYQGDGGTGSVPSISNHVNGNTHLFKKENDGGRGAALGRTRVPQRALARWAKRQLLMKFLVFRLVERLLIRIAKMKRMTEKVKPVK